MIRLRIPPYFEKRLKEQTPGLQKHVISRLEWFQQKPDDPKLRLRKLNCMPGFYLIDNVYSNRIILRKEADDYYVAADCGGHELIDEWEAMAGVPPDL